MTYKLLDRKYVNARILQFLHQCNTESNHSRPSLLYNCPGHYPANNYVMLLLDMVQLIHLFYIH